MQRPYWPLPGSVLECTENFAGGSLLEIVFFVYVGVVLELSAWFWMQRPSWPLLNSVLEFEENFTFFSRWCVFA